MLASSEIIFPLVLGECTICKGFFRRTSKQATTAKHPHAHPLVLCTGCRLPQLLFPTTVHAHSLSQPVVAFSSLHP